MEEITLAQFIADYEAGLISDPVVVKNKIYGKSSKYIAPFKIVWANIP